MDGGLVVLLGTVLVWCLLSAVDTAIHELGLLLLAL